MTSWEWAGQFAVSFLAISLGAVFSYVLATWRELRMEDERRKVRLDHLESLYDQMQGIIDANVETARQAPQAVSEAEIEHVRTTFWQIHQDDVTRLEPRTSTRLTIASFFGACERLSHWLDMVQGMEDTSEGRVTETIVSAREHRNDAAREVERLGETLLEGWDSITDLRSYRTETSFIDAARFCLLGQGRPMLNEGSQDKVPGSE